MSFENFGNQNDLGQKNLEIGKKNEKFDPDARVDRNESRDAEITSKEDFNPDQKIMPEKEQPQERKIDADTLQNASLDGKKQKAKNEISKQDLIEKAKEYISDLKSKAEYGETISETALDVSKLKLLDPEKVADKHDDFDNKKSALRKEWESINHKEWPKYTHDVYSEQGKLIRKAGDNLDAHHIQPIQLGGENVATNITPMDLKKHSEIHSKTGTCTKLVEKVKEGVN